MYTKAKIFNLALGALLLKKRISDTETDISTENQTLNVHWETALYSVLEDLDLDGTSSQKTLELRVTEPNDMWNFAYKYPVDCALLRRIQTSVLKDNRTTQVPRRVGIHDNEKVIFCDQEDVIIEYIPKDVPLNSLSANVGLAIAYKLALLSAPLIAGKGADKLRAQIEKYYLVAKGEAQEHDRMENANFDEDAIVSEFVEERTS